MKKTILAISSSGGHWEQLYSSVILFDGQINKGKANLTKALGI
jgi:hypothetical protein